MFEYSVIHSGPFSGKLDTAKDHANALTTVYANVLNKYATTTLKVDTF